MSDLEELMIAANKLCSTLDRMAAQDHKWCNEICQELEVCSWNTFKAVNDVKQLILFVAGG